MRLLNKLATIATLALLSLTAHGGMISSDWQTAGDNKISIDTATGLEWLKITETRGYSFTTIQEQLGAGGLFEGFRLPTETEIESLWRSFFPNSTSTIYHYKDMDTIEGIGTEAALAWTDALGYGYWGTPGYRYNIGFALSDTNETLGYGFVITEAGYGHVFPGQSALPNIYTGILLVSGDTAAREVPVPASSILMLLGLTGLFFARKKA